MGIDPIIGVKAPDHHPDTDCIGAIEPDSTSASHAQVYIGDVENRYFNIVGRVLKAGCRAASFNKRYFCTDEVLHIDGIKSKIPCPPVIPGRGILIYLYLFSSLISFGWEQDGGYSFINKLAEDVTNLPNSSG